MKHALPSNGRASDACIWIVSGFFLIIFLVTAGVLLVLYFVLPELEVTIWFPPNATIFVGIPWVFWIVTSFCRHLTGRRLEIGDRWPVAPAPSSKTSAANNHSPINSPGISRNVHLGAAAIPGP